MESLSSNLWICGPFVGWATAVECRTLWWLGRIGSILSIFIGLLPLEQQNLDFFLLLMLTFDPEPIEFWFLADLLRFLCSLKRFMALPFFWDFRKEVFRSSSYGYFCDILTDLSNISWLMNSFWGVSSFCRLGGDIKFNFIADDDDKMLERGRSVLVTS